MKKTILLFAQRVGALCYAVLDVRPKLRGDIRSAARGLLRTAEMIIRRLG